MVNIYRKHLSEPWFSLMAVGCKTIEGRLNCGEWTSIEEGEGIDWYNDDFGLKREFRTFIISKKIYKCFGSYLYTEGLYKILPTIENLEDGLKIYYTYNKPKEEEKYCVVALELQVSKN
jgi:ASC-1-like (ASCH) protein